jgi:hypothetical protein
MTTGSSLQSAIQLTVAITYDSNSNVHLALTIDNRTIHADSFGQKRSPTLIAHETQSVTC